jgi:Xaa-Pro dipeptidase
MTGHMDRDRATSLMRGQKLDGLLLFTPENFFYATGVSSMLFELYRHPLMSAALVPARPDVAPGIMVNAMNVQPARTSSGTDSVYGYSVFMGNGDVVEEPVAGASAEAPLDPGLPEQYDRVEIVQLLARMLREFGLSRSRIGVEFDFVDVTSFAMLQEANPEVEFVDAGPLMFELRAIKNAAEIDALRKACLLTDAGIRSAVASSAREVHASTIQQAFEDGVWETARGMGIAAGVGRILGAPNLSGVGIPHYSETVGGRGAIVKFDVQVAYARYHSDIGRTYVIEAPTAVQTRVWSAMVEAQQRGREAMRAGTRMCDIFAAATIPMQRAGFVHYQRGHCGHSVGLDACIEEPPFLGPRESRRLEPGMVFAVERPFGVGGVGVFHIEDICLVTKDGCEVLNNLPRDLGVIP